MRGSGINFLKFSREDYVAHQSINMKDHTNISRYSSNISSRPMSSSGYFGYKSFYRKEIDLKTVYK